MGENTKIEWAHHTFNPWYGCTKVGPGCDNCYAESWAKRSGLVKWGFGQERRRSSHQNWSKPLRWDAEAERLGVRYRVFCASLADVFDNAVPNAWRIDLFSLIANTPHLDWLLVTKRIGNVMKMCSGDSLMFDMIADRVWLGITICNQEEADRDIPKLLEIPAHIRFLSMEPLLGLVDISFSMPWRTTENGMLNQSIDWVIAGGESGPKARPMHPNWIRSIRDQCSTAGVPFLFKQWGEWQVSSAENGHYDCNMATNKAWWVDIDGAMAKPSSCGLSDNTYAMVKVGKKAAGRTLDGILHNGSPK